MFDVRAQKFCTKQLLSWPADSLNCSVLQTTYTKWADGGTEEYATAYGLFFGGLAQFVAGMWAVCPCFKVQSADL